MTGGDVDSSTSDRVFIVVRHHTVYRYDRAVRLAPHLVRLRPAPGCRTPITGYELVVSPAQHTLRWIQDPLGNVVARVHFPWPAVELSFTVDFEADMTAINPFAFVVDCQGWDGCFVYEPSMAHDLGPYLLNPADLTGPRLEAVLSQLVPGPSGHGVQDVVEVLAETNRRVQAAVAYRLRPEPGVQSAEQTLASAVGSCRDSAWLLVEILRRVGFAARFVSGYLVQLMSDQPARDEPPLTADVADLHAWAEVYLPGAGWLGLDPTSGLLTAERHIPLAVASEPAGAAPVSGTTEAAQVRFDFNSEVHRIAGPSREASSYP